MASAEPPFGSLLRRLRGACGLTQEELAERAGISPGAISALERGDRRTPHRDTVEQLALALQLPPEERERFGAAARRKPSSPAPSIAQSPGTPFVGRSAEYRLLERHLEGRGPPVMMLAGEPGIGKSRLLRESVPAAAQNGYTILEGGCQRRQGEEPYSPLLETLSRYIGRLSPAQRKSALAECDWLVRLIPEISNRKGPDLPSVDPVHERRLVFAAVARFLHNVAGPAGTLLLLDDLQWASADGLDLLSSLVRSPETLVRVIGAYRDTEAGVGVPLSQVLADLAHAQLVTRVHLEPLSQDASARLLDAMMPEMPRTDMERRVLARAGGVPFFLVSCAQGLISGSLGGAVHDVPWDVVQSIRQRVVALPSQAGDVLGSAAVIGRTFSLDLLLTLMGNDEEVVDGLDAACDARLVEEESFLIYRFSHDVVREAIYGDLSGARRALLHRRVARALEESSGPLSVESIAYHYDRGGDIERAALWAERAGDRAAAIYASAEAIEQFERARHHLQSAGGSVADLARLDEKVSTPLYTTGQYDRALQVLTRALDGYQALGEEDRVRAITARIGKTYFESGYAGEGRTYVEPLLDRSTMSRGMADLFITQAHLLWRELRFRECLDAAEHASHLAQELEDDLLLADAEMRRGSALWKLGDWQLGGKILERAAVLAESVGDLEIVSRSLSNLGELFMLRADFDASRRSLNRALEAMERRSGPSGIVYQNTQQARLATLQGRYAEARSYLDRAFAVADGLVHGWVTLYPRLERARLELAEGRWEAAAVELESCAHLAEERGDAQAAAMANTLLAEVDLARGRPCQAYERAKGVMAMPSEDVYQALAAISVVARAALGCGGGDEVHAIVEAGIANAEKYGAELYLQILRTVEAEQKAPR